MKFVYNTARVNGSGPGQPDPSTGLVKTFDYKHWKVYEDLRNIIYVKCFGCN